MNMNISIKAGLALCAAALDASSRAASEATAEAERDDYAFLVKYMPDKDCGKVSEDYLRRNVRLAREALAGAAWRGGLFPLEGLQRKPREVLALLAQHE